jgi:putative heme-binding domain-containing protein
MLMRLARESVEMRRNAVWALTRIDGPAARDAVRIGTRDLNESIRQIAVHSISLWRDAESVTHLYYLLQAPSQHNRRAAAEALGRIGDKTSIPFLLTAIGALDPSPDRMLEHSLVFALIEIGDAQATRFALKQVKPAMRRAALIAIDQIPGDGLDPQMIAGLLGSSEPVIRETAAWIVGRHPEWGDALAAYLRSQLVASGLSAAEAGELEGHLARFARSAAVQDLLAQSLSDKDVSRQSRLIALRAIARSGLKELPPGWIAAITTLLADRDPGIIEQAVLAARGLPPAKTPDTSLTQALSAVVGRRDTTAAVRVGALAAIPGGLGEVSPVVFDFLRAQLDPEKDVLLRSGAADVLARSRLTTDQLAVLADAFKSAGPIEADRLLPAYKEAVDETVGLKLLAALKDSPVLGGLRIDALKTSLAKFPAVVHEQAEELYQIINVDASKQKEKLESLLAGLKPGDIRRGQIVFHSSKAACAVCHPFGYLGGNVGPDLTKIGQTRSERDLLEAIVFPSASFVRSFEPVLVLTRSGKAVNGLVKSESADEIILTTGPKEEARIARDDIEEMRPGTVSVMPSRLDQQLTPQDLADLIAYLKAAK